jgi:hypothetical protein
MYETLQHEPFSITNKDDALLVARYLVEDNTEDFIILDEHRSNDILVIKDVFKRFVNKYQLYTPEQEAVLRYEIAEVIIEIRLLFT